MDGFGYIGLGIISAMYSILFAITERSGDTMTIPSSWRQISEPNWEWEVGNVSISLCVCVCLCARGERVHVSQRLTTCWLVLKIMIAITKESGDAMTIPFSYISVPNWKCEDFQENILFAIIEHSDDTMTIPSSWRHISERNWK